jgi:hypothetical protein
MIQTFDLVTFNAYEQLLALPDPPEMPRRGHVWCQEGRPNRRVQLLPTIMTHWLQHRHLAVDGEDI